jgi:hypothetical protein
MLSPLCLLLATLKNTAKLQNTKNERGGKIKIEFVDLRKNQQSQFLGSTCWYLSCPGVKMMSIPPCLLLPAFYKTGKD